MKIAPPLAVRRTWDMRRNGVNPQRRVHRNGQRPRRMKSMHRRRAMSTRHRSVRNMERRQPRSTRLPDQRPSPWSDRRRSMKSSILIQASGRRGPNTPNLTVASLSRHLTRTRTIVEVKRGF
jgi:hypothetical protein